MNTDFVEDTLQRMLAHARQVKERVEKFLTTQPPEIACALHPDCVQKADLELSINATFREGVEQAVYSPCSKCQIEQSAESERLHRQGVPKILLGCTFANWKPRNDTEATNLDIVKQFTEMRRGFLVMLGSVGTGKTHLAVAAMRHFEKALIVKQSTLLWKLRKTYRDSTAEDPIEACQKAKLLVIDEMGLSQGGRDELPLLFEIIDYRHGEFLPTILTGNIEWPEMVSLLGSRLIDRLRQSAFKLLVFGGDSHRSDRNADYFARLQK